MNPSEPKPCCHCTHVRAKGEGTGRVSYYCVRHDSRVQPWETCPKFQREPGADDDKGGGMSRRTEKAITIVCTTVLVLGLYWMSGSWHSLWGLVLLLNANVRGRHELLPLER